jgi:hypothetical protein
MTAEGGILFSNENFGAFFLIFISTVLLFLHKRRQAPSSSSAPSASPNVSVPLSSSNRIPGPLGVDHSKELALTGSLTAYVSLLHKEYNSSIVQFYRSPGDLVVSCYDVELLNSTLRGMGTRPSGLFEFLTRYPNLFLQLPFSSSYISFLYKECLERTIFKYIPS